jgi:hypothetical protein
MRAEGIDGVRVCCKCYLVSFSKRTKKTKKGPLVIIEGWCVNHRPHLLENHNNVEILTRDEFRKLAGWPPL